jgi:ketosteroid isomerase-like protein
MSQENVESFRRGVDAINRRDVDACLETMHPDVSFAPIRSQIEGVYRGHAGVRRWFADNVESFESFRVNPTETRDLGGDRLLMIGVLHLRARESGIETDLATAGIAAHRDGLLIDWKDYGDRQKALQAAGLKD